MHLKVLAREEEGGRRSRSINTRKDIEDGKQWCYPKAVPNEKQIRQIQACVAVIGTRCIYENFTYKFGDESYLQMSGVLIGACITMVAARLVMQSWSREYSNYLLRAGLRLPWGLCG